MRRVALAVLVLLMAMPASAAIGLWLWLNPAEVKARLQDAALRTTGRTLAIDGPVSIAWGVMPRLRIEGLRLANPPGLSRPDMARVTRLELGVALWPLLSGQVALHGVRVAGAEIRLERDAAGLGNWERPAAPPSTAVPTVTVPARRMQVMLDSAAIEDATVAWFDGLKAQPIHVESLTIDGGTRLRGRVVVAGVPLQVVGTGLWPLTVTLTPEPFSPGPGMNVTDGAVTITAAGPDGPATAQGAARLNGAPLLLEAQVARDRAAMLTVTLAGATVAGKRDVAGIYTGQMTIAALAEFGRVVGLTLPDVRALESVFTVAQVSGGYAVDGRAGVAGQAMQIKGLLGWPRRSFNGTIMADRIDLDAAMPPVPQPPAPVPSAAAGPAAAPPPAAPPPPAALPPAVPWDRLRGLSGDLQIAIGTLRWRATEVGTVAAHAHAQDGLVTLDPVRAIVGGGLIEAWVAADAPGQTVHAVIRGLGSAAGPLLALAGLPPVVSGPAELDVDMNATGPTVPALLASATGRIGLAIVGGEADLAVIPGLAQLARGAPVAVPLDGRSRFRCAAVRANLVAGRATLAALALDSPRLALVGDGTIGLPDRTLALRLRPTFGIGSAQVAIPVRVSGPWAAPVVKMESDGGRASVTIGTGAAAEDPCPAALLLARNGRTGTAPPAPDAPKSTRPADLLRTLLR